MSPKNTPKTKRRQEEGRACSVPTPPSFSFSSSFVSAQMDGEVLDQPPAGPQPALVQCFWLSRMNWQQKEFLAEIVVNEVISAAPRTLTLRPGFPAGPGGPWMPLGPCEESRREEEMASLRGTTDGPRLQISCCWGCQGHQATKWAVNPLSRAQGSKHRGGRARTEHP